jgi:hypothetical protein
MKNLPVKLSEIPQVGSSSRLEPPINRCVLLSANGLQFAFTSSALNLGRSKLGNQFRDRVAQRRFCGVGLWNSRSVSPMTFNQR